MKKFLGFSVLGLLWCTTSSADTISDYEVGGLKLGKSLYELMTQEEMIENIVNVSENEQYYTATYIPNIFTYPDLDFGLYMATFDINDEELKIVSFFAFEEFPNDFEGCMKKQNIIANKFEKIFKIKKEDLGILDISEKYGEGSKWRPIIFEYRIKRNTASVLCYHYADQPDRNNIKVTVHARKYADYITVK